MTTKRNHYSLNRVREIMSEHYPVPRFDAAESFELWCHCGCRIWKFSEWHYHVNYILDRREHGDIKPS